MIRRYVFVALFAAILEYAYFHSWQGYPYSLSRIAAVIILYAAGSFLFRIQKMPDYKIPQNLQGEPESEKLNSEKE